MRIVNATGVDELTKLFERAGLEVQTVLYRAAVQSVAAAFEADLVALSSYLDGREDLGEILYNLRRSGVRVLLFVGSMRTEAERRLAETAVALGIYDLVPNPVSLAVVTDVLSRPRTIADATELLTSLGVKTAPGRLAELIRRFRPAPGPAPQEPERGGGRGGWFERLRRLRERPEGETGVAGGIPVARPAGEEEAAALADTEPAGEPSEETEIVPTELARVERTWPGRPQRLRTWVESLPEATGQSGAGPEAPALPEAADSPLAAEAVGNVLIPSRLSPHEELLWLADALFGAAVQFLGKAAILAIGYALIAAMAGVFGVRLPGGSWLGQVLAGLAR